MPNLTLTQLENRKKLTSIPDFSGDKKWLIEEVEKIINESKSSPADLERDLKNWKKILMRNRTWKVFSEVKKIKKI